MILFHDWLQDSFFNNMKTLNSKNNVVIKNDKGIVYIISSLWIIGLLTFLQSLPQNCTGIIHGINYNYFVYFAVAVSAFGVFLICRFFFCKNDFSNKQALFSFAYIVSACATMIFLYIIYDRETQDTIASYDWRLGFIREDYPHPLFAVCMLIAISVCGVVIRNKIRVHICLRYLFSLILAFVGGTFAYAPNPFQNGIWGVYHIHAYTNSIVHIANLEPYDDIVKSIYGHYAMVYFPFVRLLGDDFYAIARTIAVFTFVVYFCAFYVLINTVKDDLLCIFSMIAVLGTSITFMGKGEYFQIMPHRCLFPIVVLAFIVWHNKHRSIKYIFAIGCLLLGMFSILFNLETGLVCAIVLAIAFFLDKPRNGFIKWIKGMVIAAIFCVVCFVGAYLLVNAYNLKVDGSWNSIKTFIFPIASEGYNMQEILRTPIPKPLTGFMVHIVVFLVTAFSAFLKLIKCDDCERDKTYFRLIISICGMGVFTYFINRTVGFGLSISHIQLIILLAVYADMFVSLLPDKVRMKRAPEETYIFLFSMIAFELVIWFALEGIMGVGNIIENHRDTVWDKSSLEIDIENFAQWKPDNATAIGIGVPELYYQIGEDVGLVLTDWGGTIDHPGFMKLGRFLENETDEVIVGDVYAIEWALEDYEEIDRFEGNNFKMKYYKKK